VWIVYLGALGSVAGEETEKIVVVSRSGHEGSSLLLVWIVVNMIRLVITYSQWRRASFRSRIEVEACMCHFSDAMFEEMIGGLGG
jgi:hypothetical protein